MMTKVLAWVRANWKPLAFTTGVVALYVMAKWFPDSQDERDLLYSILAAWGVLGAFVPRFARPHIAASHDDHDAAP
jgi:hypothetical protein